MARHEVRGGAQDLTLNADITSVSTSCQANGTVAGFPTGAVNQFIITIDDERILCSSLTGSSPATITFAQRGYDGTTSVSHTANATIVHGLAAADIDDLMDHAYDTSRDDHSQYLSEVRHAAVPHSSDMYEAGSVDNAALQTGSVDNRVIGPDAVGVDELAADSVGTVELQDNAVHTANVADSQLTRVKMAPPDQFPAGVMVDYGGEVLPTGWLWCDGDIVLRADYPTLFANIGEHWGAGNGITTFQLPDFRGRVGVGLDNIGGVDGGVLSGANVLGDDGGEQTHVLTSGELGAHTHSINHDHAAVTSATGGSHQHGGAAGYSYVIGELPTSAFWLNSGANVEHPGADVTYTAATGAGGDHNHSVDLPSFSGTSGSTGSDTAHNNMQPYVLVNKIIKY